jgi:flagellar hook-associated protein 3 FlgL
MERITNLMTSQATINELATSYDALAQTQEEMSTGLKINQPSDNPYGASQVVDLGDQLSELNNYTSNVNDGTAWLNTASTALTSINNSVQSVRELVVEASNGTMTPADLSSAAAEVNQLIDSVKSSANTTYDGSYIFSGSATDTAPYQAGSNDNYQGNNGTISRTIGPGTSVAVNTNLSTLLGNGTTPGDGGLLDTLRTIANDMQTGSTASLNSLRTTDLTNLDGNLSTLQSMQANTGALTDRMTLASSQISGYQQTVQTQLASTQDADLSQTAIDFSTAQAAYTAALKAGASIVQNSLDNFLN